MGKKLTEMSLEELWALFPIFLTEHQQCWKDWYEEERAFLQKLLPSAEWISHIGSTAIDGIWSKPIIDMLIEVPKNTDLSDVRDLLVDHGYLCMSETTKRVSMNKGYTENGFAEKVFHLHVRIAGDNDELYFRDYLNAHSETAKVYETLKLQLWKKI